ncbi:tRNA (adenosine(37)-N6)-dimethylallyltransferase MiaA [Treponema sp. OttesenSCG-928-L16]|nr:tRNA (adenosine(37)-N6)-dimethylallyltransferase MiaA [Treponema sp. OttesenSCG-928-L16]
MPEQSSIPVFILFGPTASGKTDILECLFARDKARIPAEVVSADSMQVYRGMDIGTAKPPQELRQKLPHHLIDIRDPDEQFNAGEFVRLADEACADIRRRGKLPVLSGGTGFYLRNFVLGLPESPPSDPELRRVLKQELAERGGEELMRELSECDPVSAGRIHINDEYRLLRALEVYRSTGRPLSSYAWSGPARDEAGNQKAGGTFRSPGADSRPVYRFLSIGLRRPREELYERINQRCHAMFTEGLPDEVRRLRDAGYGPNDPGMKAIGYKEFFIYQDGKEAELSQNFPAAEELIARNSRRYAKRQILYFSSIPDVIWIDAGPGAAEDISSKLENFIKEPEQL